MTETWAAVLVLAAGCFAFKFAGISVPERMLDSPHIRSIALLLPIALLAGLTAVQTFSDGRGLVIDARAAGVAAAAVALLLRAPFLVVVLVAAAVAAGLRAVGVG
jgi:hypothetical protein